MKRPNILWIQTDEHRPDSLGCYGSEWAKTPNLDMLAENGVVMQNCVCQSPVCVPSRASQLTGLYPQEINTVMNRAFNEDVFPKGTITFPEVLAENGYQTISLGKHHIPKHRPWQKLEWLHWTIDPKYADYCVMGKGYDEKKYNVVKRPGIHPIIVAGTYPIFKDNPTMKATDLALETMRKADKDKPFMLRISYNWPHTPVLAPPPFDRLYHPEDISIQYFDKRAYQQRADVDRAYADAQKMFELSEEQYEQMWKDYMGLVGYMDYEVGRLLTGLKALGLDDNTIVMFSSDHGRALGEFGHGEKCSFDEQVWRVPFIFSWPDNDNKGQVRRDVCELIDTGRTLLGLVGLEDKAPQQWRGRDLFDGITEYDESVGFGQIGYPNTKSSYFAERENLRKQLVEDVEFLGAKFNMLKAYPISGLQRVAIRTSRYRMDVSWMKDGVRVTRGKMDGNLIDLENDPKEKKNLWKDKEHKKTVDGLLVKLEKWFEQLDKPELIFG